MSEAEAATPCALCGQPADRFGPERELGGEPLRFCCPGCLHVFDLLYRRSPGGDFRQTELYRACLGAGLISATAGNTEREGPASSPAGAKEGAELFLAVDGMWCGSCAWVLQEMLRRTPGVLQASVSFATDAARVRYLPHRVGPDALVSRIEGLGYGARPIAEAEERSGELRGALVRLCVAGILSMHTMMLSLALYAGFFADLGRDAVALFSWFLFAVATPTVFYCGSPILKRAWAGLRAGVIAMDALIAAGVLSAYGYSLVQLRRGSLHLYFDTAATLVAVVLLGRYLESRAKERISRRLRELQDLAAAKVRVRTDGVEAWVGPRSVSAGDLFVVRVGEVVGVDGEVVGGVADLDLSSLTGEARPARRALGDAVSAGARVLAGELRLKATRPGEESSLRRLAFAVEEALGRKGEMELLADRVTRWLAPAVLALALGSTAWLLLDGVGPSEAVLRGIAVLVITCPCALGVAAPLAKVAAVARARDGGALVRDRSALERAAGVDVVVFDKTGTLTEGSFVLRELVMEGCTREEGLGRIASAERRSTHYLAREILRAARREGVKIDEPEQARVEEGLGLEATVGGERVLVGNRRLLVSRGVALSPELERRAAKEESSGATAVFAAWGAEGRALLSFGDALKPSSARTVARLREEGVQVWLLSGDSDATTTAYAGRLGVDAYRGGASPDEKVGVIRELQARGLRVAAVGDGINDAAALAQADVGFALAGAPGAAQHAADVTLLSSDPAQVLEFRELSRRTVRILRQNLFFAFFYNALAIPLAVAGTLNPLVAAAAMVASSLTVLANTARISGPVAAIGASSARLDQRQAVGVEDLPG